MHAYVHHTQVVNDEGVRSYLEYEQGETPCVYWKPIRLLRAMTRDRREAHIYDKLVYP